MRRGVGWAAAALVAYAATLVWLTWPLGAQLTTHLPDTLPLPGRTDVPYIVWALAYQTHALASAPWTLFDGNIYYPARWTLFYGDPGFGALPLFAPVFLATGNPTLAINVVFLGGVTLTALALFLLVWRWTGSTAGAFVAGMTLVTNPWTVWGFLPWAPSYAALYGLPAIAWLGRRHTLTARHVAGLALLVAAQALTNVVYLAVATVGTVGLLALVRLARRVTRPVGWRILASLGLALVLLTPVYTGYLAVQRANPGAAQSVHRRLRATRFPEAMQDMVAVRDYGMFGAVPIPPGPLGGPWPYRTSWTVAIMGLVGIVVGWRAWRTVPHLRTAWAHGAFWFGAGLLMGTPAVKIGLSAPVVTPWYALVGRVAPFVLGVVREPNRLGIPSLVGVALLAGAAVASLVERAPARWRRLAATGLAAGMTAGLCVEYGMPSTPYPLVEALTGDSAVVRALAAGAGPVLELPVGPVSKEGVQPLAHARAMYRSIFHWRPLLNGYSSYWPDGFKERMALALALPDPVALDTLRRETGLTHLVVDTAWMVSSARAPWDALVERGGRDDLRLVAQDREGVLFAVSAPGEPVR